MPATTPRVKKAPERAASNGRRRLFRGGCAVLLAFNLILVGLSVYVAQRLDEAAVLIPKLPEVMRTVSTRPTEIVSGDGKVLHTIATELREPVRIDDVPQKVILATLAAEDKRFFNHPGIDAIGMGRAAWSTLSGRRVEGGSTITMQVVKGAFTGNDRTMDRKIRQMALAFMLERQLTKRQVLELYLNQAYYGAGAYGVAAAAEVFFDKRIDQLTWSEAALLARCVRRPSDQNPFADLAVATRNRDVVLGILRDEEWITPAEYDAAIAEKVTLRRGRFEGFTNRKLAPYFVDYVRGWVRETMPGIDLAGGGYRIETTLDFRVQQAAERHVQETLRALRRNRVTTAAFVLLERDGRILAMVGGGDYGRNQFNVVTQGRRQPGSAFKPFVYATAFEYGVLSPYGSVSNAPFKIREQDGTERFVRGGGRGGSVSVRSAMAQSINVPAMWAIREVGVRNVVTLAENGFGFSSNLPAVDSLALGSGEVSPLEMASGYSVFMTGGTRVVPFGVRRVIGPDGLPVVRNEPTEVQRVIGTTAAEGIDGLLRAVVTGGTGRRAAVVKNARGKTGTTSDNRDAWFCGYTDRFIGVGWVANEVRREGRSPRYAPMAEWVMGGHVVAPLWAAILLDAQRLRPEEDRLGVRAAPEETPTTGEPPVTEPGDQAPGTGTDPEPVDPTSDPASGEGAQPPVADPPPAQPTGDSEGETVTVEVCADSGQRATVYCPERATKTFRRGSEPKGRCPLHRGP